MRPAHHPWRLELVPHCPLSYCRTVASWRSEAKVKRQRSGGWSAALTKRARVPHVSRALLLARHPHHAHSDPAMQQPSLSFGGPPSGVTTGSQSLRMTQLQGMGKSRGKAVRSDQHRLLVAGEWTMMELPRLGRAAPCRWWLRARSTSVARHMGLGALRTPFDPQAGR